ncbi:hypothetical protein UFOVP1462_51 [uncultured Caudovirales phage]|uniref:Uncharacterized protein n=1 Tax=uncultured Caudovirales phage TaxID=2100421 RepID=A0A6J5S4M2_9CAUD|nr:hypothetical protein UFOVP1013_51 [uncultured Caudovirales phage]CAB4202446.1 hypothetical protein UFOVP1364_13 [uncultured Caudovirales phage]CAB4214605.1 hypothetical protein UFOVP1462_51 [uncultured Caudovirales phage]CAB5228542.1 hypothetical protein UFOVP1550_5 [uncultured Caudovirales phage]
MPLLGIMASAASGRSAPTNSYFPISSFTVPSGGLSSITIGGIPQIYSHLQIRMLARATTTDQGIHNIWMRYNGDTTTACTSHWLYSTGATSLLGNYYNNAIGTLVAMIPDVLAGVGFFGSTIIDILDYTSVDKYKTLKTLSGSDCNGAGNVYSATGLYPSFNAVNSITLTPLSGTTPKFAEYSNISIYGVY